MILVWGMVGIPCKSRDINSKCKTEYSRATCHHKGTEKFQHGCPTSLHSCYFSSACQCCTAIIHTSSDSCPSGRYTHNVQNGEIIMFSVNHSEWLNSAECIYIYVLDVRTFDEIHDFFLCAGPTYGCTYSFVTKKVLWCTATITGRNRTKDPKYPQVLRQSWCIEGEIAL